MVLLEPLRIVDALNSNHTEESRVGLLALQFYCWRSLEGFQRGLKCRDMEVARREYRELTRTKGGWSWPARGCRTKKWDRAHCSGKNLAAIGLMSSTETLFFECSRPTKGIFRCFSAQEWVSPGGGWNQVFLDRARAHPAQQVQRASCFVVCAGCSSAAKRLHPHHSAGGLVI
jgi:hypothetical protein